MFFNNPLFRFIKYTFSRSIHSQNVFRLDSIFFTLGQFADFPTFPNESPKNLSLSMLENLGISRKSLKYLELTTSTQPTTLKANFGSCTRKLQKISRKTFHRKTYFPYLKGNNFRSFRGFLPNPRKLIPAKNLFCPKPRKLVSPKLLKNFDPQK